MWAFRFEKFDVKGIDSRRYAFFNVLLEEFFLDEDG